MYDPWKLGGLNPSFFVIWGGLAPPSPYVEPPLEVGFMTLSSAYIELFIRGKKSGVKCSGGGEMSGYHFTCTGRPWIWPMGAPGNCLPASPVSIGQHDLNLTTSIN